MALRKTLKERWGEHDIITHVGSGTAVGLAFQLDTTRERVGRELPESCEKGGGSAREEPGRCTY